MQICRCYVRVRVKDMVKEWLIRLNSLVYLVGVPGKVYTKMIQERLKGHVIRIVAEEQAGFRAGRGTIDQIFVVRQLSEIFYEKNVTLYNNFIDF